MQIVSKLKTNHNIRDTEGNELLVTAKDDESADVFLRLKQRKSLLSIGELIATDMGEISYFKKEKEGGVFRKNDSWSINFAVLKTYVTKDVVYTTEKAQYTISKKEAMDKGSFLFFKTSGIEKKIYVERKYWRKITF